MTAFERRLARTGFSDVRSHTVPGWQKHMVHTWLGGARAASRVTPG